MPLSKDKPRILDAFCGAGGAARGYQDAGFYVVGVDKEPQPNYMGDQFIRGDALEYLGILLRHRHHLRGFDAIHASPPCQQYSRAFRHLAREEPKLIEPTRDLLRETGLPFIIENVPGAPIPRQDTLDGRYGVELCGSMFGLRVHRHRLFETNFAVTQPACAHTAPAMNPHNAKGREEIGYAPERQWREAMGVPWMSKAETREAIPPAFTRHIGEALLTHLQAGSKVAA